MEEVTLESLARRVEALEQQLRAMRTPVKDWRSAAGMFTDNEVSRAVDEAGRACREKDREEARSGTAENTAADEPPDIPEIRYG